MLIIADFVSSLVRASLLQTKTFLDTAATLSWCIVPDDRDCAGAAFVARYAEPPFGDRKYATTLHLPVPGSGSDDGAVLRTGLRDVTYLLAFLVERPEWVKRLRDAEAAASNDEAVVRMFGIDPDATCRASVRPWAQGSFLAPDQGGYAYFDVDTAGELSIISRSTTVLPVALHLAANREAGVEIVSRLAKTPPAAG